MVRALLATIAVTTIACTEGQDVARISSDAANDGVATTDTHVPLACPSGMIDVGALCIDATEVTRGAYAAFLATTPPAPRAECTWNTDRNPTLDEATGVGCTSDQIDLSTHPDLPVVCIDWCDADAFCQSAGKQLCGAIAGGPDAYDDLAAQSDPAKSQWALACAGEEKHAYPYGDAYVRGACRDATLALADGGLSAANAGSTSACHGPVGTTRAAVFDLSGNVAEWVDACEISPGDHAAQSCMLRGGYFREEDDLDAGPNESLRCDVTVGGRLRQRRDHHDDHIGLRCCFVR